MGKKILVTGGAGYIGSHTLVSLYQSGFEAVIVDNFSNSSKKIIHALESIINQKLQCIDLDSCDLNGLETLFETYSFYGVIHFAAFKAVGESVQNPLKYYQNNLLSLTAILSCCKKYKVKKFVFSSSCTVYGLPNSTNAIHENTPKGIPQSPYAWSKLMGEQIISDFSKTTNLSCVLLRYFNPIGAHESGKIGEHPQGTPNNILPFITQTVQRIHKELVVFGNDYNTADGTCVRDFVHVCDVAEAHVKALETAFVEKITCLNIGTGKGTSVKEIIEITENIIGKKIPVRIGNRREGDIPAIFADTSKSFQLMNWKSKRTVKQAIEDALRWEKYRIEHEIS